MAVRHHAAGWGQEDCFVYFISDGSAVKIGTAVNPEARLRNLQGSNSRKLTLLAVAKGGTELEKQFHDSFSHLQIRGEWFKGEVMAQLTSVQLKPSA